MVVLATELIAFGAQNHAEDDVSTQGGAIDLTRKISMTPMAANDDLEAVSDNAGDTTQTLTVTGRLVTGAITTEAFVLNGTTPVLGVKIFID